MHHDFFMSKVLTGGPPVAGIPVLSYYSSDLLCIDTGLKNQQGHAKQGYAVCKKIYAFRLASRMY